MAVSNIDMLSIDGIKQLLWLNRNDMVRVASNMKRALNGAPHVNITPIPTGHSILLGTDDGGMSKADYQNLKAHSETQLDTFSLSLDGEDINVIWDHTQGAAVTGQDLFNHVDGDDLLNQIVLKFLTV